MENITQAQFWSSTASADLGDTIEQSLRFRGSQVLARTFSSSSNRDQCTFSCWVKRSDVGNSDIIFGASSSGNTFERLLFNPTPNISLYAENGGTVYANVRTSALYRDPSAWYHLVYVKDTTQSTAADRIKIYINGERITDLEATTYPGEDTTTGQINNNVQHTIGRNPDTGADFHDGYIAQVYFLDGTCIGETNGVIDEFGKYVNGVWVPQNYTGSDYGTNGFHLDFADSSNPGNDVSGNNNDFTATGFDTSAIAKYSKDLSLDENSTESATHVFERAFDGDTSTVATNNESTGTFTFNPDPAISYSSSVRVRVNDSGGSPTATIGSTSVSLTSGSLTTVVSGSGSFGVGGDALVIGNTGSHPQLCQIEVDGTVLVNNTDNDVDFDDTPTNNYATLNENFVDNTASWRHPVVSNASLKTAGGTTTAGQNMLLPSTIGVHPSDANTYYAEFVVDDLGGTSSPNYPAIGIRNERGSFTNLYKFFLHCNGTATSEGTSTGNGPTFNTVGDIVGVTWKASTGVVTAAVNGGAATTWTLGASNDITFVTAIDIDNNGNSGASGMSHNYGQMDFIHQPANTVAWNTNNLPEPTIKDPSEYFDIVTYQGTGASHTRTDLAFRPDLVWLKITSHADSHALYDSVRGEQNRLQSNNGDSASTAAQGVTAFNSDGWTMGTDSQINFDGRDYVAWCWKAGGKPTATNTASSGAMTANSVSLNGTLNTASGDNAYTPAGSPSRYPEKMSINTTAGFSIVYYEGTGSNITVPHGLGATPAFMVVKNTEDDSTNWNCWHHMLPTANPTHDVIYLNLTDAQNGSNNNVFRADPDDNVFSLGTAGDVNTDDKHYIAYIWSEVEGFSKFGRYNGNNDNDGPFCYTGFKPKYLLVKRCSGGTGNWHLVDAARDPINPTFQWLEANEGAQEQNNQTPFHIDFYSNGFKCRGSGAQINNSTNDTYIYIAFAESPFGGENTPPATAR